MTKDTTMLNVMYKKITTTEMIENQKSLKLMKILLNTNLSMILKILNFQDVISANVITNEIKYILSNVLSRIRNVLHLYNI